MADLCACARPAYGTTLFRDGEGLPPQGANGFTFDNEVGGRISTKGLLIVYTGNGKGKTTAALGMAMRAAGHDLKVCFIQFIKGS